MSAVMSTRRDVLLGGAAATTLLLAPQNKALPANLLLRPDIATPTGQTMLGLYAAAVRAMQDPAINYPPQPQSWTFQVYIHAVPVNPFDPAVSGYLYGDKLKKRIDDIYGNPTNGTPQAAWKEAALQCWAKCEHLTPYFTTWHRWYLYYFERICRKMCKDPGFMLPYWNYASDNGPSLQLPDRFRQASRDPNNPNVLFFDDRGLGFADANATGPQTVKMNNGGFMPFSLTRYDAALAATEMFPSDDQHHMPSDPTASVYLDLGFTGRLECVPHGNVHDFVGGWMGNVPSAAGDPIFFVHHCQIDRLYASWEAELGVSYNWDSSNIQPDENTWKTTKAAFIDESGQLANVKLGDAINTSSLGYSYDILVQPSSAEVAALPTETRLDPTLLKLAAMKSSAFNVQSGGTTVTLTPTARPEDAKPAPHRDRPHTLVLSGLKLLRRPPAPLGVFINLPTGTPPRLNNPYYVGTLNLFNFDLGTGVPMTHTEKMNHDHDVPGATVRFDVTEILLQQRTKGQWDGGAVTITISTFGADTPGDITYVTIESATITP